MSRPPNDHRLRGRTYRKIPMRLGTATLTIRMPCHPAFGIARLEGFDYYGIRQCWEQSCPRCQAVYRYHNRRGIHRHAGERLIWWYAIDRFTDRDHPQRQPLDCFLVEWREFSEEAA